MMNRSMVSVVVSMMLGAGLLSPIACEGEFENDEAFRRAAQQADGGNCAEEYNYVVEAPDRAGAKTECEKTCSGVVCDPADIKPIACVPGNAGDGDSWLCDCKCDCDDPEAACGPADIDASQL